MVLTSFTNTWRREQKYFDHSWASNLGGVWNLNQLFVDARLMKKDSLLPTFTICGTQT